MDAGTCHVAIPDALAGQRLDRALTALLVEAGVAVSRVQVQRWLEGGQIVPPANPSDKAMAGVVYTVAAPPPVPTATEAQDIPLDVVYEDADVIVLNKPAGLVVHPAAGHAQGTLVNALLWQCGAELSGIGGEQRPGIVHRLDKDTSGLMVVAKNDAAHRTLAAQFADRTLSRTYLALVWGVPTPRAGRIDAPIGRDPRDRKRMAVVVHGGKAAITDYTVERVLAAGSMALVRCALQTGRTHQIRVHLAHLRTPLVGDPVYGGRKKKALDGFNRQALHAAEIRFRHPTTGQMMHFSAPLPEDFTRLLESL